MLTGENSINSVHRLAIGGGHSARGSKIALMDS